MKLLMINTLYPPISVGGAERVVRTLARGLVDRGDSVTIVTLSPGERESVEVDAGVKIIRLPLENIYWPFGSQPNAPARLLWHAIDSFNLAAARTLKRVLRQEQPDVVHTHNLAGFSALVWRAVEQVGVPLVHTLHDYYLLCPRSTMHTRLGNCESPCRSCSLLTAPRRAGSVRLNSVVGVSHFVLRRHEELGLFSTSTARHVVHNCLTHDHPPTPDEPAAARAPTGVLRLGFLGRVEAVKGIETLLQAVRLLEPGSWQLQIAGEGDPAYVATLKTTHPAEGIHFEGQMTLPDFFREVDLLVVPSMWNEPLGMVAFEAFFFGVPVVASRQGGLPEIVTPQTGMLYEAGSPQALAAAISELQANHDRLAKLAAGAAAAAALYEPQRMWEAYRAIYDSTIKQVSTARAAA